MGSASMRSSTPAWRTARPTRFSATFPSACHEGTAANRDLSRSRKNKDLTWLSGLESAWRIEVKKIRRNHAFDRFHKTWSVLTSIVLGTSPIMSANHPALLEDRGWRGHFFITTDRIGTPGFLTESELRDL